ncbi:SPO7 [Candida pseudojiufengensis]|uniref:SPO7 n=1 Tax=Candida pseudojiufengensis TaxID=497109 RepID=UPI0022256BBD|nr:SPO7 [Candida pseudojiufengensis]KAI5959015.1 SPO7 [Candida pseudojiufengensis]
MQETSPSNEEVLTPKPISPSQLPHDNAQSSDDKSNPSLLDSPNEIENNSIIFGSSNSSETSIPMYHPPKSPRLESGGRGFFTNDNDFVVYSDSDEVASQSSLDLHNEDTPIKRDLGYRLRKLAKTNQSSDEEDEFDEDEINISNLMSNRGTPIDITPNNSNKFSNLKPTFMETPKRSKSNSTSSRSSSPRRRRRRSSSPDSVDQSPGNATSKSKTKLRRKSKEPSEKSHKSYEKLGTGYTSMPVSGKVFRNLLILEESMREQVIQQRAMRRKYLIFLTILCSIIGALTHHLFILDISVSSTGTKRIILQFFLISTIITLLLYHLSGEYQKTIVLPRKFLSSTNKGLRQLNVRLVKIKTPLIDKVTDLIREISLTIVTFTLLIFHKFSSSSIQNKDSKIEVFLVTCQSQCQPRIGVTDVKLLLNARVFNIDIREGWETYRSEFWINEGVRRRNNMLAFINGNKVIKRRKRKSIDFK